MARRRRRELALQKKIVSAIKRAGGAARIVHQDPRYTMVGDGDIYGCYMGRMFVFEVKTPGEKPRKLQKIRLAEWRKAGALVRTIYSVRQSLITLKKRA